MKVGIGIDSWKLACFKKHLDSAKFAFTENPGASKYTLLLKVSVPDGRLTKLNQLIAKANNEARTSQQGSPNAN